MNRKLIFSIVISVIFLYLAFRQVDIHQLRQAFYGANYVYLLPVLGLTLISLLFRAIRWRFIMAPVKPCGIWNLFMAIVIGFALNNLLPARLGELARAYAIGEKERIPASAAFATIVLERLLDGFTIMGFLMVIVLFDSSPYPDWLDKAARIVMGFYAFVLLFLILLKWQTKRVLRFMEICLGPFPDRIRQIIMGTTDAFTQGLQLLTHGKHIWLSVLGSLAVWVPAVFIPHFLLMGMKVHLPVTASMLLIVILCFGLMIPSAPGFVGTFQFFCITGLAIFSVPKDIALSFSIIYHASQFIPVTIAGVVAMTLEGKSITEIRNSVLSEQVKP